MAEETPVSPNYGGWIIIAAGILMLLAAICIWIAGLYQWLRYGTGLDYTSPELFADLGLAYPKVSWVGVQKAIDIVMSLSAAWLLLCVGIGVTWIGGSIIEARDRRDDEARRAKSQRERELREDQREARANKAE